MVGDELRAAIEALLSGTASEAQSRLLREASDASHTTLAFGNRTVSIGGDIDRTTINTGDNVTSFSIVQPDATAIRQVVSAVFQPRLHQLPPDLGDFTGRTKETDDVVALLKGGGCAAISAFRGMGGVGKSALAVHIAHQISHYYPDGQIYIELGGTSARALSAQQSMARVIRSFEPAAQLSDSEAEIATIYRSVLSGKRVLLLLDNAFDTAQVRPLLPPLGCATIITARRALGLSGAHSVDLGVLSKQDAQLFLESIIGPDRTTSAVIAEIADLCWYLPLALRVAGTFLLVHSDWTGLNYAQALSNERLRLRRLRLEDDATLDVLASLLISETQLTKEHSELSMRWHVLSVFPNTFSKSAAAAIWKADAETTRDGLSKLVARSMLLYDSTADRYRLHDLMRDVARGLYIEAEQKNNPIHTGIARGMRDHAVYYLGELMLASGLYDEGNKAALAGLQRFDLERHNIMAGQRWAAAHSASDKRAAWLCIGLSWYGSHLLNLRLSEREAISWATATLEAARRMGERKHEAAALNNLGAAFGKLRDTKRAVEYLVQAASIGRKYNFPLVTAIADANIAHFSTQDSEKAISALQMSADVAAENDDFRAQAGILGNIGMLYRKRGDPGRAIELCGQSLKIARGNGHHQVVCTTLGILANANWDLKDYPAAAKLHEDRLEIARDISDHVNEMDSLSCIGQIYVARDMFSPAIEIFQNLLEAARIYRAREYESDALYSLGSCHGKLGNSVKATTYLEQALSLETDLGRIERIKAVRLNLATSYTNTGNHHEALNLLECYRVSSTSTDDFGGDVDILAVVTDAYARLGDEFAEQRNFAEALQYYKSAAKTGRALERGKALVNSAMILGYLGHEQEALSQLALGTELLTAFGAPEALEAKRLSDHVRKR